MESELMTPMDEAKAEAVRAQLKRLLEHHVFKGSRRCARLLEYLVEYKLRGETVPPKERMLGIDVFEREPDYDTADDPVVRGAANETRKRMAQYYLEPGHENEVRFDLPAGSYMLEFHIPEEAATPQTAESAPQVRRGISPYILVLAVIIIVACVFGIVWMRRPSALDRFWNPILNSSNRVLICLLSTASPTGESSNKANVETQPNIPPPAIESVLGIPFIGLKDNEALVNIVRLMNAKKTSFEVQYQTLDGSLTNDLIQPGLSELRKGSAIFIGGSDWSYRILPDLRFHTRQDSASDLVWIEDTENPSNEKWSVKLQRPFAEYTEDYAIISRIADSMTGQNLLLLTGIGLHGTAAAGEFVTNSALMNKVASGSSPEWQKKNVQIVIYAEIAGKSWGTPQLLAKHFW